MLALGVWQGNCYLYSQTTMYVLSRYKCCHANRIIVLPPCPDQIVGSVFLTGRARSCVPAKQGLVVVQTMLEHIVT